jgi:hypothetical protein
MVRSFPPYVNRQPLESERQNEIRFCRYRLEVLVRAPEQNRKIIDAVQERLKGLQAA